MNLRAERLPQRNTEQFGQNYLPLSIRQDSYMHRLEISDDGVYQSSVGYLDQNRSLLPSIATTINKQQKYQQQQQRQQSYNNTYTLTDQLDISQPKDSSLHSLVGIYKSSSNTVEFMSNFEQYLNICLPSYAWIGLMFLLILWGLIHIIVGTVNIPFCPSRPMIPVFLIVMGCLYILWSVLRIYAFWPRSRADTLGIDLTCKVLEGIMIVAILVWLFLGCIWIYGTEQNLNFERIYFQPYHCDGSANWTAFISITLHLAIILSTLLLLFCLLCVILFKDSKQ